MSHAEDLAGLAREIEGAGWRTKPMSTWTDAERRAYEAWAKAELAAMRQHPEEIEVSLSKHSDPEEVGEFVRVMMRFDRREPDE